MLPVFIVEQNLVGISAVMRVQSPPSNARDAQSHRVKILRHPQNRKYTTYRNAVRGGLSHGHMQRAQKL